MQWNAQYGLDGGPTEELSSTLGAELLQGLEWRAPSSEPWSEALYAHTPEAAVLLSATFGAFRKTLTGCLRCSALIVIPRASAKLAQCPHCGARKRGKPSRRFLIEFERAYDRVRKRSATDPRLREMQTLKDVSPQLSDAVAIARLKAIAPIGPRVRQRTI